METTDAETILIVDDEDSCSAHLPRMAHRSGLDDPHRRRRRVGAQARQPTRGRSCRPRLEPRRRRRWPASAPGSRRLPSRHRRHSRDRLRQSGDAARRDADGRSRLPRQEPRSQPRHLPASRQEAARPDPPRQAGAAAAAEPAGVSRVDREDVAAGAVDERPHRSDPASRRGSPTRPLHGAGDAGEGRRPPRSPLRCRANAPRVVSRLRRPWRGSRDRGDAVRPLAGRGRHQPGLGQASSASSSGKSTRRAFLYPFEEGAVDRSPGRRCR